MILILALVDEDGIKPVARIILDLGHDLEVKSKRPTSPNTFLPV
jgi:hypothetical protein